MFRDCISLMVYSDAIQSGTDQGFFRSVVRNSDTDLEIEYHRSLNLWDVSSDRFSSVESNPSAICP